MLFFEPVTLSFFLTIYREGGRGILDGTLSSTIGKEREGNGRKGNGRYTPVTPYTHSTVCPDTSSSRLLR